MSDPTQHGTPASAVPHSRWAAGRRILRLVFAPIAIALAILYFIIDAVVLSLVRPVVRRVADWPPIARFTSQIAKLGPYPTLALVLIPIILLEPLKPIAVYLMTKRHHVVAGTILLAMTEIVKIVAVERLFHLSRAKLMTIPAFAWIYNFTAAWLSYLENLPPWQWVLRLVAQAKTFSRRMVAFVRDLAP